MQSLIHEISCELDAIYHDGLSLVEKKMKMTQKKRQKEAAREGIALELVPLLVPAWMWKISSPHRYL